MYVKVAVKVARIDYNNIHSYTLLCTSCCCFCCQKCIEVANNAEKLIAVIERQALLEVLLQAMVINFDLDDKSKLSNVSLFFLICLKVSCLCYQQLLKISDQLNTLVKDQSHHDILLMHLLKKYHGPQGVLGLLAEKHRKCWEPLNCLKLIKEQLKVCTS